MCECAECEPELPKPLVVDLKQRLAAIDMRLSCYDELQTERKALLNKLARFGLREPGAEVPVGPE